MLVSVKGEKPLYTCCYITLRYKCSIDCQFTLDKLKNTRYGFTVSWQRCHYLWQRCLKTRI